MSELIINNFLGANVTIGLEGLPILITGTVINSENNIIRIKTEDDKIIHVAANLIVFFY